MKVLITKEKVHDPCWKCYIPFLWRVHIVKLLNQGFVSSYHYHTDLHGKRTEYRVVNEADVVGSMSDFKEAKE